MQSWGRRLVVSISDSGWSLVVVLLAVAFFGWFGIGVDGMRAVGEGPRGAMMNGNGNTLLSTKGREGPLRATKNGNCNTLFSTKGREGPRRTTKNGNCNTSFLRRAAKKTFNPLIHVGIQRAAENASLFYWGVAIYVGTGTAVWDVRGAEGDLTRPIFAAMMERGGCGIAPAGSRLDSVDGLPDEDE